MLSSSAEGGRGCRISCAVHGTGVRQHEPMTLQPGEQFLTPLWHLAPPSTPTSKITCASISPAYPLESFSRPPTGRSRGLGFRMEPQLVNQRSFNHPHQIGMTVCAVVCPYCLAVMTKKAETNSYVCEKCGHIAAPDKVDHTCPCAKCADQIAKKP
jgi:hypothetical protein